MTPWKLSSFNFSFHGRIQIFNIMLNYSQVGKQRIPFKEIEKSKMKTSLSYQSGIEIWIKDQKAVLEIHKATWKTYVVKLFMILFTMKHRQCWLELKKGGEKKKEEGYLLLAWLWIYSVHEVILIYEQSSPNYSRRWHLADRCKCHW